MRTAADDASIADDDLEEVTPDNCARKLPRIRKLAGISRRDFAKILGVSEGTLRRLEGADTRPTDDFLARLRAVGIIGVSRFRGISDAERDEASRLAGAGGVIAGMGGALAAVSGSGSVAGLSAAGITSGLAAIGGGAMLAGLGVVASVPVAAGLAGYGLMKGLKAVLEANNLESQEVDGRWEIRVRSAPTRPSNED